MAVSFNGIDQAVSVSHTQNTCAGHMQYCTNGLTWAMWLRPLNAGLTPIITGGGKTIYINGDNDIVVSIGCGSSVWELNTLGPPIARWTHVVVTWSQTTGLRLFYDGYLRETVLSHSSTNAIYDLTSLMGMDGTTPPNYGNFALDEVLYWTFVKSDGFIAGLFHGYGKPCPALIPTYITILRDPLPII